jgi:hypothetical protein
MNSEKKVIATEVINIINYLKINRITIKKRTYLKIKIQWI